MIAAEIFLSMVREHADLGFPYLFQIISDCMDLSIICHMRNIADQVYDNRNNDKENNAPKTYDEKLPDDPLLAVRRTLFTVGCQDHALFRRPVAFAEKMRSFTAQVD